MLGEKTKNNGALLQTRERLAESPSGLKADSRSVLHHGHVILIIKHGNSMQYSQPLSVRNSYIHVLVI